MASISMFIRSARTDVGMTLPASLRIGCVSVIVLGEYDLPSIEQVLGGP